MQKRFFGLILAILLITGIVFATDSNSVFDDNSTDSSTTICPTLYAPVCGELQVVCIKAPCDPIKQTYSNSCTAKAAGATVLYEGECKTVECPKYDMVSCPNGEVKYSYYDYQGTKCAKPYCADTNTITSTPMCGTMDYSKGKNIAINSCGALSGEYYCNEGTSTWWFDLELEKEGCNPHCVVNTRTGIAEINYMCTGVIPPEQEKVYEQVKCVFANSTAQQKCYAYFDEHEAGCTVSAGQEACIADVKGEYGEKITWKSTCGGYAYTIMDGKNEYAKFDCSNSSGGSGGACACTMEYAPVCGEIKVCTTACSTAVDSSEKGTCESKCYAQVQTFGNKCIANCEGANILYSGECGANCPEYMPPYCPNGNIIVEHNEKGCAKPKCVEAKTEHYTSAKWRCSNGKEFKITEKCMPYSYWKNYAKTSCAEYSSKDCASYNVTSTSSGGGSSNTGNFLLEVIAPAATSIATTATSTITTTSPTNTSNSTQESTTCMGSEVYVTDFEVFGECDPECKSYVNEKGCKAVKCTDGTITEYCNESCPSQNYEEIRAIKDKCYASNGDVVVNTDKAGCSVYSCAFSTSQQYLDECTTAEEIPKEKYYYCEENGGKIVSKTNEKGCLTVFECVMPSKGFNTNSVDSALISDQTKLLELALKLETLKIELQKVANKINAIADYYASVDDVNSAAKFENATSLLESAINDIDQAKILIKDNIDSFDEEKALMVREIIREIREEVLREVLLALLA